jgi:DNA-binding NtrC family response regulator
MEPVDGFEFIRIIRSEGLKVPVILVTGDDNPDLLNESSKLGVGAVLKKPVQKDRLIKTISRTLNLERRG